MSSRAANWRSGRHARSPRRNAAGRCIVRLPGDDSLPRGADQSHRCLRPARRPDALQRGPGPHHTRAAHLGHIQLHRALVLHVDGGDGLHACVQPHRRRNGLQAGARDGPSGQSHRPCPNAAERARGRQVRHSLPGLCARFVWRARRKHSRHAARAGGLRVVRHPDLDRRPGHLRNAQRAVARVGVNAFRSVGLLPRLLAAQHGRGMARRGVDPFPAELFRALSACHVAGAARLHDPQGRRLRPHAQRAQPVPHPFQLSCTFSSSRSPASSATGPRSRSTFPTSRATPVRRSRRSSARPLACRLP